MKGLKIGVKLGIGYGVMFLLMVTLAGFGSYQLATMKEQLDHIANSNMVKLNSTIDALEAIQDITSASNRIAISEDAGLQKSEREKIEVSRGRYREAIGRLEKLEKSDEGKAIIAQMKGAIKEAATVNNKALTTALAGNHAEARRILTVEAPQPIAAMMQHFYTMRKFQQERTDFRYREAVGAYQSARTGMIVTLLVSLVLGVLCAVLAGRSITKPLKAMVNMLKGIAQGEGDLTQRLVHDSRDELGEVAGWFNRFVEVVHDMVQGVSRDGIQVVIGSNLVHVTAEEITSDADSLVSQAASVATASEEMSTTSNSIACNCVQAAEGGQEAQRVALDGAVIVQAAAGAMNLISERVHSAAAIVEELGQRSNQIGEIVETIEDIADQTNLLALNAAIEAARAGEQGRGFAVVADEVRALATRTTKATSEIGSMIRDIQLKTRNAVASMEGGMREVERGAQEAERSGAALTAIVEQINAVNLQVSQIATAAEEQSATTCEIAGSIQGVTAIARKSSESAHETMATSHQLTDRARDFMAVLAKFKVEEDVSLAINKAKAAHLIFVANIKAHLDGQRQIDPAGLPTHLTCAFGKWVQGEGRERCHSALLQKIDAPHARVHELGKQAVTSYNAGERAKAEAHCHEMTVCSQELLAILEQLEGECACTGSQAERLSRRSA